MSDALERARELLEQATRHARVVEQRHAAMKAAFERREIDLETYLAALRDLMLARTEITVSELRMEVLSPAKSDGHIVE